MEEKHDEDMMGKFLAAFGVITGMFVGLTWLLAWFFSRGH